MDHLEREQQREAELQRGVEDAVQTADHMIMMTSDGSTAETDWLTMQVALRFMEKAARPFQRAMFQKQMDTRKQEVNHGQSKEV